MTDDPKVWVTKVMGRPSLQLRWNCPETGKVKTKAAGTNRRREAERAAAKLEADLAAGKMASTTRITWADFRRRYEDEYLVDQADATGNIYATAFNKLEAACPGLKHLRELNETKLAHFHETMRREKLSLVSIKTYLGHIRAALFWAVRQKMISAVPNIEMPKRAKGKRMAKGRPLSLEEFERMLATTPAIVGNAAAPSWQRLLWGLWLSGLRIGEALRLSWDEHAAVSVQFTGKHPRLVFRPDGQKAHRYEVIPTTGDFEAFLQETPAAQRKGRVFRPMAVQTGSTAPMGEDWASKCICNIGEAAGIIVARGKRKGEEHIKYASAHDLRRSFATRWAPRVKAVTLQKMLRHRNIATTLAFYVDQDVDDMGDELRGNVPSDAPTLRLRYMTDSQTESTTNEEEDQETQEQESQKVAKNSSSGGYRARTGDLLAASQTLSQLS